MNMLDQTAVRIMCEVQTMDSGMGKRLQMGELIAKKGAEKKETGGKVTLQSPFSYLADESVFLGDQKAVAGSATSIYRLMFVIGIIGLVCSFLFLAFKIATTRKSDVREEAKDGLLVKSGIGIAFFSMLTLLNIFHRFMSEIV